MENEFCSTDCNVPCLLDDLMDSEVIKCDVGFGMTFDPVFVSKESPSHESDSGCSDMSEVRSVSPLSEIEFSVDDQVKLFDFHSVPDFEDKTDELEEELETYLAEPLAAHEEERILKTPSIQVCDQPSTRLTSENQKLSADKQVEASRRIIQSRALKVSAGVKPCATIIKLPFSENKSQTDIHVLPSHTRASNSGEGGKSTAPTVKVVKVVKTPAQTKEEIDKELFQALDDRNKKNAIQAKLNREKKKAYMKSLEDEIDELKCENIALKEDNRKVVNEKNELLEEIEYLKGVLANQSVLSGLLKNIGSVENVKLSSSFSRKRSADLDHGYHNAGKRAKKAESKTAGVCLHVDQGNVSLEFCSKCATMAKSDVK